MVLLLTIGNPLKYQTLTILLFLSLVIKAQDPTRPDTPSSTQAAVPAIVIPLDTDTINTDSILNLIDIHKGFRDSLQYAFSNNLNTPQLIQEFLGKHRYFNFLGNPIRLNIEEKEEARDEYFFYMLWSLLFFYAMLRNIFAKYHDNLFVLFFRASLRQQQIKDQLLQSPIASLLFNLFFFMTMSLFIAMVARNYHYASNISFNDLWTLGFVILTFIYLVKFLVTKSLGWVLNLEKASEAYIFVVFLVNKVTGILLLPVILLISFPNKYLLAGLVALTVLLLLFLIVYRYRISYRQIKAEIKLSPFHFFLYLCAFEVTPLLILKKVVTHFVENTF